MTKSTELIKFEKGMIPPQAIDLEEAILGAMMIDEKGVDEVMSIIKRADVFYKEAHQHVFIAIQNLFNNNQPIDILTVSTQLKKNKRLADIGGDYYIIQLAQKVSSSAHSEFHSRIILQHYMKRQYLKLCSEIPSMCYDESVDVFDIENHLELMVDAIRDITGDGKNQLTMDRATQMVVDRVEILSNMKEGEITGVPTGFTKIDKETSGWQNSDLIVIASRPGMGKSSICSATILAAARNDYPVGVISLEMSTQQLVTRLMANNSNFHLNQLFRHGFKDDKVMEYFPKLLKLRDEMVNYPVYFNDTPALDIRSIKSTARIWHRKHNIKMLIVDYLQLIKDSTKSNNREQEISAISGQLKAIAKELDIPVIALSQLSRKVEDRGGFKKPQLSDLRESGAIEQDADLICFIWRPEYYGFDVPDDMFSVGANTEFTIAKHRNGSLNTLGIWFDSNKTKFQDANPEHNKTDNNNGVPF